MQKLILICQTKCLQNLLTQETAWFTCATMLALAGQSKIVFAYSN
jgi:hypothetical protein